MTVSETLLPPRSLTVNLLASPFCIDRRQVAFSWVWDDLTVRQQAFRLTVAEGLNQALSEDFLFDSGWITSPQSMGVELPTLPAVLRDGQLYYVRVAVADPTGRRSDFSRPFPFATSTVWIDRRAIWARNGDGEKPLFSFARHEFSLDEAALSSFDRVLLSAAGSSPEPTRQFVSQVAVNGQEIGLTPSRLGRDADGQPSLFYQTYDITPHLRPGRNCVAALNYALEDAGFLCQITAYDRDGHPHILTNSAKNAADWRVSDGDPVFRPAQSIGTHYFTAHGNNLNTALFPDGFDRPGFDDRGWEIPTLGETIAGGLPLVGAEVSPIRRYEAPPDTVTVTPTAAGTVLVDLGKEIIGGLRLTVCAPASADIRLCYGEQLTPDGQVKFRMNTGNVYEETWTLRRGEQIGQTYGLYAFRYVEISGLPAGMTLRPSDICGLEIRAPHHDRAAFTSDHPLLNDLYALVRHTVRVTTQDIFVDSQSRERGPYEGDALINLLAAAACGGDLSVGRFTLSYLLTHRTWPADYQLLFLTWARLDYVLTSDRRFLASAYPLLREKLYPLEPDSVTGLLPCPPHETSADTILVDWPASERDGYDMAVPFNTVFNALWVRAAGDLAAIAAILGRSDDADRYNAAARRLRASMIQTLYDPARGCFADGLRADGTRSPHVSQHATAYALAAGIYDDPLMGQKMAAFLADDPDHGGQIRMSVYGAFFLLEGLSQIGRGDVVNRWLLDENTSEGARTWAYMLRVLHATTTTEAWNETNKPNMTLSHPWGAAPAHLIVSGICGIRPTAPGYASFEVRFVPDGLTHASVVVPTVRGLIEASFDTSNGFRAKVTVPGNTTAAVILPAGCFSVKVTAWDDSPSGSSSIGPAENGRICLSPGRYLLEFI